MGAGQNDSNYCHTVAAAVDILVSLRNVDRTKACRLSRRQSPLFVQLG